MSYLNPPFYFQKQEVTIFRLRMIKILLIPFEWRRQKKKSSLVTILNNLSQECLFAEHLASCSQFRRNLSNFSRSSPFRRPFEPRRSHRTKEGRKGNREGRAGEKRKGGRKGILPLLLRDQNLVYAVEGEGSERISHTRSRASASPCREKTHQSSDTARSEQYSEPFHDRPVDCCHTHVGYFSVGRKNRVRAYIADLLRFSRLALKIDWHLIVAFSLEQPHPIAKSGEAHNCRHKVSRCLCKYKNRFKLFIPLICLVCLPLRPLLSAKSNVFLHLERQQCK